MPKVPKVNSFTTQPLNHLTTQLLSSFVVAQKLCMFIAKIKALREINDSDQAIGKNLRQASLSPFLAFNKAPCSSRSAGACAACAAGYSGEGE